MKWISVDDYLPPLLRYVLLSAVMGDFKQKYLIGIMTEVDRWWYQKSYLGSEPIPEHTGEHFIRGDLIKVTHWAKLIEHPKMRNLK